ncbi:MULTISPECIES: PAS domain S-box protein [unclassified Sphingomonas]|uniref:PAS domain-containing sensor histidine kinase n=1 Tax=unclassified Sphingomonas TaxID=196159 RepID=UPI0021519F7D|nr:MULTISPECIES: PAS domain S-box protein [unclassified Sphingomonas]MCR5872187.1 PAS domain S-box protein [Sphingomonas sp. J344]UUX99501.1 PAS domain S-box protein [Sphingomonas sp. J315]
MGGDTVEKLSARFIASDLERAQFLIDPEGMICSWNPGAQILLGYATEMAVGQPVAMLYSQGDAAAGKPHDDLARAATYGRYSEEGWRRRQDATEFAADARLTALRDEGGTLLGFGGTIEDITDRKAAEAAVARSELHLRSILATVPDAMIVIDERGQMLSFSAAAERLFGYSEAEVVGKNVAMMMPDGDRLRHDDYVDHYCRTGERRIIGIGRIVVGKRRDGSEFPMELAVGEARSAGHRIFTGFIRDLSERQRAELQMKELQSELIHVSRVSAMGTMASTLAHELNQPLTAIANYMEAARDLIARGTLDPDLLGEAVSESATEALRAGSIVRRLREFVARGEVEKRVEPLPQMVEEATRLAMTGARERGVRALKDLDPDARLALVDRVQIQQVLVNLIRNAVEALGDMPVRDVTIATRLQADGMIRVEVSDTGPGIDPAIRPRLFDAFNTNKPDGLGLGLSICRTIVEAHGGRIDANPRSGGGTVLWFTIPSAETHE